MNVKRSLKLSRKLNKIKIQKSDLCSNLTFGKSLSRQVKVTSFLVFVTICYADSRKG